MVYVLANDNVTKFGVSYHQENYAFIDEMCREHGPRVVIPLPDIDPVTLSAIFNSEIRNVVLDDHNTPKVIAAIISLKAHPWTLNSWVSRLPFKLSRPDTRASSSHVMEGVSKDPGELW